MNISVKLEGLDKAQQVMRELGPQLAQRGLRKGLQAGADVLGTAIQAATPIKTGLLKASVGTSVSLSNKDQAGIGAVGFGKQGYVARLVEFGHRIVSKGKKLGKRETGKAAPHPFMRPAFDASAQTAVDAFIRVLRETIATLGK